MKNNVKPILRRGLINRFFISLAAVAVCGVAAAPATADTLQDIASKGVVRIGVFQDYPPFGSVGTDMKPRGFDVDFAAVLGKALGAKVEFTPVTGSNRIAFLTDRKVDLLMSVGKTGDREKILDFSASYAPYYIAVFGPASIVVREPADLAGRKIATAGNTNEDIQLSKVAPPTAIIKRFDDQNGAVSAYFAGQAELISLGGIVASTLRTANPKIKLEQKFKLMVSNMHLAFNKGEAPLKQKLDMAIAQSLSDGTLNRISVQWLGEPLPATLD